MERKNVKATKPGHSCTLSACEFPDVPPARSRNMRAIRSRDTGPERIVRSALHRMGYRFRLHVRDLPGCPDIVLPRYRAVVFVHGCFWHAHRCRAGSRIPKTNSEYWEAKRSRNKQRHQKARRALRRAGWAVLTIWECQVRDLGALLSRLETFLGICEPRA